MMLVAPRKGPRNHTNFVVTTTPLKLADARTSRKSIVIQNLGAETIYIGPSTVVNSGTNRGYALFQGTTFTDNASDGEWWAVASATSAAVHVIEIV